MYEERLTQTTSSGSVRQFPIIFWKFCRPHTIIGTSLQVLTAYFLACRDTELFLGSFNLLALAWLSSVAVNIYVVGLNQIFDWKIDRVNKPFLPLASGELSPAGGWMITLFMGVFALISSYEQSIYLFGTIATVLAIGTLYSLPKIYLKGQPVGAALAISLARGLVSNIGIYLHFRFLLFQNLSLPWSILAFALYNWGFSIVIALMKDAPDLSGDKQYGVKTLTVRIGVKAVFSLALRILTAFYIGLSLAAWIEFSKAGAAFLMVAHLFILILIWRKAIALPFHNEKLIYAYYMFIWKLFYFEFGLFSLATVL